MSAKCSRRLAKTMWQKRHSYYEICEAPGQISRQSLAIDFTSSRIKVKLTSSKNEANVQHMSHSGLTPNAVTSTNIGSPVPSTEIPHHQIIPQPSESW
ncbi:hypothetical protein O181_071397 [Austropuccinia psidii MF-1]|uniref:Uncharacterized protein n=1 Tax=Austropuccinia psidii MF-1 TaxID=1389203 RepID=A0A9Q3F537_9BASI|nr:hypothetical protein [Austropuccinia psidii MF-1]